MLRIRIEVDRIRWASASCHNRSKVVYGADNSVRGQSGQLPAEGIHLRRKR